MDVRALRCVGAHLAAGGIAIALDDRDFPEVTREDARRRQASDAPTEHERTAALLRVMCDRHGSQREVPVSDVDRPTSALPWEGPSAANAVIDSDAIGMPR